nr:uncharacterized protein LOC117218338 [Megalopta genalis]
MDTIKIDSHIENRNEILLGLKKICNKNSGLQTTNSEEDSSIFDIVDSQAFPEHLLHANKWLTLNLSKDIIQESDRVSAGPVSCSGNASNNKRFGTTKFEQHTKQDNDLPKDLSSLSTFSSQNTQSYLKNIFKTTVVSENYVISESQSEGSFCSNTVKDSEGSQEAGNNNASQEKIDEVSCNGIDYINKLVGLGSLPSQIETHDCNDLSHNITSETERDISANENASNVTFHECCSLHQKNVDNSRKDDDKILPGLRILDITPISQKLHSSKRDITHDIFQSNGENCFSRNEDESDLTNLEIDSITRYQRCSLVDNLKFSTVVMDEEEWINDKTQELCTSSFQLCGESIELIQITQNVTQDVVSFQQNGRCLQGDNSVEDEERMDPSEKRRNLDLENKVDALRKNEGKRIPSAWLTLILDAPNTNNIPLESMKATLSVLLDEKVIMQYMKNRCWKDTIEMQLVNAILNFCNVFESENKNKAYTNEIIQVVTNTLDKCIGNRELEKATILIHQVTIIVELCACMGVCIEVINYLLTRLKSYEGMLTSLATGKKADVHNIVNPLHIIFYSLNLCLEKYRLVVSGKDDNHLEEHAEKQADESRQIREGRWQMILNDFTTIAVESFIKFTEMSQRLLNILTRK